MTESNNLVNSPWGAGMKAGVVPSSQRPTPTLNNEGMGLAMTADGHAVGLLANVGGINDAMDAVRYGAEGVGLLRTEQLFLGRHRAPTVAEQTAEYAALFAPFGRRRVIVRVLDGASDQPLPFLNLPAERYPALGMRGIRLLQAHPELLADQMEALMHAAVAAGIELWVMAPMVSDPGEARWFREQVDIGIPAGVMIEVPAAALAAETIFGEVDFASIGTNNLSQHLFAADWRAGNMAPFLDPWQPALLDLIQRCGMAAEAYLNPLGVCGAAAADPLLAPILVGLGVSSLSMRPDALPAVQASLARHTLEDCEELASAALDAESAVEGRTRVQELIAG